MIIAVALFVGSAWEMTVIVTTLPVIGIVEGAVYDPVAVIVPVDVDPPVTPFTWKMTPLSVLPTAAP